MVAGNQRQMKCERKLKTKRCTVKPTNDGLRKDKALPLARLSYYSLGMYYVDHRTINSVSVCILIHLFKQLSQNIKRLSNF